MEWLFCLWTNSLRFLLDCSLSGLQSRSEYGGEEERPYSCRESNSGHRSTVRGQLLYWLNSETKAIGALCGQQTSQNLALERYRFKVIDAGFTLAGEDLQRRKWDLFESVLGILSRNIKYLFRCTINYSGL